MKSPSLLCSSAAIAVFLASCSGQTEPSSDAAETGAGMPDKTPLSGLNIQEAEAVPSQDVPLATLQGVIALPPESRMAVTPSYAGTAKRIYVIEGQNVTRGQILAQIHSPEQVQIRAELTRAQAAVGLAENNAKRLTQLASEGVIAMARADEAKTNLVQARAALTAQRRLLALSGVDGNGIGILRAPISGRVSHVGVVAGEMIDGTNAPFVIDGAGAYQIELQVPERLIGVVRQGMAVEIAGGAKKGKQGALTGRIIAISPTIDSATRSVLARASITADESIVVGRNVSVLVKSDDVRSGVSVPAKAVTKLDGRDVVFVRAGKKYVTRAIALATRSGDLAVISSGLKAGEIVAISSLPELKAMSSD